MKILYLCGDPGAPIFGRKGCSTHIRETCLALKAAGHELRLICADLGEDAAGEPPFPITVAEPYRSRKLGFDLRHILLDRKIRAAAERHVREWAPDAVYERYSLYGWAGAGLARRHRLPHLLEANAFISLELRDRLRFPRFAWFQERRIFRAAREIVVVSDPLVEEIAALRGSAEGIHRMPMAVNVDHFRPGDDGEATKAELGLTGRFTVGYVGTLTGWHGIDLLFDLARAMKERGAAPFTILVVGGDDRRIEQRRAQVAAEGLAAELVFHGAVPYAEIPRYVRAMDVTLSPDTTYWSSPAKLFEYQGCGRPALAPRYPAVERAMTDGVEGYVFEPKNIAEMADRTMKLQADPALRERMGAIARVHAVEKHSWTAQVASVARIFESQAAELGRG